jgi:hypothetical protein
MDIISMSQAVQGRVVLGKRWYQKTSHWKFVRANKYNQMDFARSGMMVLIKVYNAKAPPYGKALHDHFSSLQAKGYGEQQLADMRAFGINGHADMHRLVDDLTHKTIFVADIALAGLRPICVASVATAFVHLCETRQVLNAFGADVVIKVLASPAVWRKPVKAALNTLQIIGTAQESHAVTLVRVAAKALAIDIPAKRHRSSCRGDRSRHLLIGLAAAGLAPKALLVGIPEWRAMYIGLMAVATALRQQFQRQAAMVKSVQKIPFAKLLALARKKGLKGQPYKSGKRTTPTKKDLVRMLSSQAFAKVKTVKNFSLRPLRNLMRKHGGDPLPWIDGVRVSLTKSSIQNWLKRRCLAIS